MVGRLEGKVAIVTGGGTGIGEAVAHKFATEGAKVVVAGLPGDPVNDVVRALRAQGHYAEPFMGDLAEEGQARSCVAAFLTSDEASVVTGALYFADGGTTIAKGGPGDAAPGFVKQQLRPTLDLRHSHDGLKNKPRANRMHS